MTLVNDKMIKLAKIYQQQSNGTAEVTSQMHLFAENLIKIRSINQLMIVV